MSDYPRIVHFPPIRTFGHCAPDKWMLLKNLEEAAELVEAGKQFVKHDLSPDRDRLREAMLAEYADVLQTMANTAMAFRISDEEIARAMSDCLERNRRRGRL